jgi:hypothetical protein
MNKRLQVSHDIRTGFVAGEFVIGENQKCQFKAKPGLKSVFSLVILS